MEVIVLRTSKVEQAVKFLEQEHGMIFTEEKHDDGPVHYSNEMDGTVLEIYPVSKDTVLKSALLPLVTRLIKVGYAENNGFIKGCAIELQNLCKDEK